MDASFRKKILQSHSDNESVKLHKDNQDDKD